MMDYELYWNTNDGKHVSTNMVISGSFGKIAEARAYAYSKILKIKKEERTNVLRKSSKIIEIIGVDSNGNLFDVGRIGTIGSKVVLFVPKKGYYEVKSDGAIKNMR